jgi:hypothetical protein
VSCTGGQGSRRAVASSDDDDDELHNKERKDKRHSRDNQDKEVVQMKYREQNKNPGGGDIFHICSDRPWDPPTFLCNG